MKRLIERAGREVEEMIGYAIPKPRMLEVPSMVFMLSHPATRVDFILGGDERPDTVHFSGRSQQYPCGEYVRQSAPGSVACTGDGGGRG